MKRLISVVLSGALAAGCSEQGGNGTAAPPPDRSVTDADDGGVADGLLAQDGTDTEDEGEAASDSDAATSTDVAETETRPPGAREVLEDTANFRFRYSYPEAAGRLPELAALLDRRLDRSMATLSRQAADARQQARANGFPYNKLTRQVAWEVVGDLPGWLSMAGEMNEYTGGAHGMYGTLSLVWNKADNTALEGRELFVSNEALQQAVGERFCKELNLQRAARRGDTVVEDAEDIFTQCPPMEDLVVLPASSRGQRSARVFDRLILYAGPYVAGPYAEGDYTLRLNVDAAIMEAAKPEYRASFGTRN